MPVLNVLISLYHAVRILASRTDFEIMTSNLRYTLFVRVVIEVLLSVNYIGLLYVYLSLLF